MGNEQPKKITRASKTQIDIASLKAKIHLELMRDRKNNEVIKGEKELVNRVKSQSRNKTEEILLAERVVNGLKYAQACNQLMSYAVSIRAQANFISENMLNPQKMAPWLPQIYSLLYAADMLGLSSLKQFKDLMRALNDPTGISKYVNPEIIQLLTPQPTPEELNIYILQFSERNAIELQQINIAGHKFTKDLNPISPDNSFTELEKRLAEELKGNFNNGQNGPNGSNGPNGPYGPNGSFGPSGYGEGPYGSGQGFSGNPGSQGFNGGQGWGGNQGPQGWGGNQGNQNQGYYNLDKPGFQNPQSSNPYGIRDSLSTPNFYTPVVPPMVPQTPEQPQVPSGGKNAANESRISIKSIADIDYYPEIQPVARKDPDFDKICQLLKAAL